MGLSIPYNSYKGKLQFGNASQGEDHPSRESLRKFASYLIDLESKGDLKASLHLDQLQKDLDNGLWFDSTIPQGFGIGSSGALVASVYERYGLDKIHPEINITGDKIAELKQIFSQMESYFHGKSSGLDPLICYLNLPVLIKSSDDLGTVGMPENNLEGKGAIFLINSGTPGETQPMVNIFMEKMKQKGFRNMLREEFTKYNDACINAFLNKDISPLFTNLKKLSKLLLDNFKPMIPSVFHNMWKEGIDSNAYYLKLCGSGGGGYFLGFTRDLEEAKKRLHKYDLEVVFTF